MPQTSLKTSHKVADSGRPLKSSVLRVLLIAMLYPTPLFSQDVEIHGFISQGYLKTVGASFFEALKNGDPNPKAGGSNFLGPTKRGSWEFAEVGLNFSTVLDDDLSVGLQLFARDLGELGSFAFELDWGFVDYNWFEQFSIRLGRIKMPYGLYGEYRDLDLVRPSVLMPQAVYFESLRDLQAAFDGVEFYGTLDGAGESIGSFDYNLFAGSVIGPATRSKSSTALFFNNRAFYTGEGNQLFEVGDNSHNPYMFGGSLQWSTPVDGLVLNFSSVYYLAMIKVLLADDFTEQLERIGQLPEDYQQEVTYRCKVAFTVGSLEYTHDDLVLAAEYSVYYGEFQSTGAPLVPHSDLYQERYYIQASYRLSQNVQISGYYGYQRDPRDVYRPLPDRLLGRERPAEVDTPPADWTATHPGETYAYDKVKMSDYQSDYSAAIRFDLNDFWIIKFEGHLMHGTEQIYAKLNPNNPEGEEWWYLFAAKSTMVF